MHYLREAFRAVCPPLEITSRRVTEACRKRRRETAQDFHRLLSTIEADCFEAITTADLATLITAHTHSC